MRIRTIKPEWLEDEALHEAGMPARIASVALVLLSDDYGNGRANLRRLAARVFWGEVGSVGLMESALSGLIRIGFLSLYNVRGQQYFHINNWAKHQRVDKPGAPRCPGPDEADGDEKTNDLAPSRDPHESSLATPVLLAPDPDPDPDQDPERECAREAPPSKDVTARSQARFTDPLGELPKPLPLLRFVHQLWTLFIREQTGDTKWTVERLDGREQTRLRDMADWATIVADSHARGMAISDWETVAFEALRGSLTAYERECSRREDLSLHPGFWYQRRELWTKEVAA